MSSPRTPVAGDASAVAAGPRSFSTTRWSLVIRAGRGGAGDTREALEELCRKYWPPLYRFARRRGASPADAEDLTQGFFADLLRRGAIGQADSARGRFRTFLLTSFSHYCAHERDRAARVKRGGGREIVSYDAMMEAERQWAEEPATDDTPERIFDRRWATDLLDHALAELRREYQAVGREKWFDELRPVLQGGWRESSCAAIADRLRTSEDAVRVAATRLRQRFRDEVRREVSLTVADEGQVDEELRILFGALTG